MMHELFMSPFFGIGLSIAAFWVGTWIRKKTGLVLCNPLVLAIVIVSGVLLIFKIPYEEYNEGGALINMFLAPATACLAVSIYTRAELLKKNWLPIVVGASCGSLASMGSVLLMCKLFGMDEAMTVSLIPKSVTTPIASQRCRGTRRNGAHYRCCGYFYRHSGKHFCTDTDQTFPGKRSDDRPEFPSAHAPTRWEHPRRLSWEKQRAP